MTNKIISITPIGGLGAIGANMQFIETANYNILIDAGILFPKDDTFAIDCLIPNFYDTVKRADAIFITHAHEDHIGAITFILKAFPDIKVYATQFAAALIHKKAAEKKLNVKFQIVIPGDRYEFDDIIFEPFSVNHSIPETVGINVYDRNHKLSIAYISDFKLKEDGSVQKNISSALDHGHNRVLFTDSTNILKNNKTVSEAEAKDGLQKVIHNADHRIFITCFASNIFRIQSIVDIAASEGRFVVPHGRSMLSYMHVALELGILKDEHNVIKDVAEIDPEDERQIVLLTGCQGEFLGTLRRVTMGEDSDYKISSKDLFIFSSSPIPGSELSIVAIQNELSKLDIEVVTSKDACVHASGHISGPELINLYRETKPDLIVPVHGEQLFLKRHRDLILKNLNDAECHLLKNGDSIVFYDDETYEIVDREEISPIMIHGKDIEIEKTAISERRKICQQGLISVGVNIEWPHKRNPQLSIETMGLPEIAKAHLNEYENFMVNYIKTLKITDKEKAKEEIRVATRRFFLPHLGYRPIAIIHLC